MQNMTSVDTCFCITSWENWKASKELGGMFVVAWAHFQKQSLPVRGLWAPTSSQIP